jgi:hypothetical protein
MTESKATTRKVLYAAIVPLFLWLSGAPGEPPPLTGTMRVVDHEKN